MNRIADLLLAALLLVACPLQAEILRDAQGTWSVTAGKSTDLPPDAGKRAQVLAWLNEGSAEFDAGNHGAAISRMGKVIDEAGDSEAGAVARHIRAKAYAERSQFEPALDDLRWVATRRIDYPEFDAVLDLELSVARRLAAGDRRWLGGWMPWFTDRSLALGALLDVARQAPNGRRAADALMEHTRLAIKLGRRDEALDSLERIVSEHPDTPYIAEAMGRLAELRAADSPGPAWDQSSAREAIDALETLMAQYPDSAEAKEAEPRVRALRNQIARARLDLAKFYWIRRNNPRAARLMAASAVTTDAESEAGKEAAELIAAIDGGAEPPATLADAVLGRYPRPRGGEPAKTPAASPAGSGLEFKEEPASPAAR